MPQLWHPGPLGPGMPKTAEKKVAGGGMAYPTGKPRGRRTMTTRTLPTETGRRVQECTSLASMTGEGPTVSSWGGVDKHTIPTCAPKPEDREAPLPPPWSDGHDARDIKKPQELKTPLCSPIVLKNLSLPPVPNPLQRLVRVNSWRLTHLQPLCWRICGAGRRFLRK